jgi:hypothetical protein
MLANRAEPVRLEVENEREDLREQSMVLLEQILLELAQGFELRRYIRGRLDRVYQTREIFPRVGGHQHCHHC